MKLFKLIASKRGRVLFDDRIEARTPREARNQMRALLGLRSLSGVVYSITEIPVELIGEIAEARTVEALRRFEDGETAPGVEETIRVAAAEEVRKQLGELRAEALADQPSPPSSADDGPGRFDPFSADPPEAGSPAPPREEVVERVRANAVRRRRQPKREQKPKRRRGRPSITVDGRVIDWVAVKRRYLVDRSLKQTAAAFDLSVNTVKARARKERWADS